MLSKREQKLRRYVKDGTEDWSNKNAKQYSRLYKRSNVTPYVHIMVYHVPEFIGRYKSLKMFSRQSLEKTMGLTRQAFMLKSNMILKQTYSNMTDAKVCFQNSSKSHEVM